MEKEGETYRRWWRRGYSPAVKCAERTQKARIEQGEINNKWDSYWKKKEKLEVEKMVQAKIKRKKKCAQIQKTTNKRT